MYIAVTEEMKNKMYWLYNVLVNKKSGISYRYHKVHDGSTGFLKIISWIYLLYLNFAYYILHFHFFGTMPQMETYETKALSIKSAETQDYARKNSDLIVKKYIDKLKKYDVISFDVFDTLILRPISQPTDIFYFIGERMEISDFKNIRIWAEGDARVKCMQKNGHMEVTLEDIWKNLAEDVGCSKEIGVKVEQEIELSLCYANPFMLDVWKELKKMGKKMIVVSDMYLSRDIIKKIIENAGFMDCEKIYVSCEYGKNKASGSLFKLVKSGYYGKTIIHVGDNIHSDKEMAEKNGFATCVYPNVNHNVKLYRPFDMSYLIGSAYRGIISNCLYNGTSVYGMEYEYGFIYGGLFVVGYCNFIHEYCKKNNIGKILFLSRDGDILKQAYTRLYPNDNTAYVYWSRKAATKLMAMENKHDYFRRFIYHKINQNYTIREILHSMELDFLLVELDDWKDIWLTWIKELEKNSKQLALKQLDEENINNEKKMKRVKKIKQDFSQQKLLSQRKSSFIDLKPDDELTDKNGFLLRRFIEAKWEKVKKTYESQTKAAKIYYNEVLKDCTSAAAVDIGWAGSGAMALRYLVSNTWNIHCDIYGIVAGTNTIHNAEPDASEAYLQSGKMVSYLYSQSHNRDLMKMHNPSKDYNVYWELLLASPTPQFIGFYDRKVCNGKYLENLDISLVFGKYDKNQKGILEIQKGILDFLDEYQKRFKKYPYMFRISGRDAYAPMIVAASHNERYLRAIEKKFALDINVN